MGSTLRFPTVIFDWGDTLIRDDPAATAPMVDWPKIEVVEGARETLAALHAGGRRLVLATGAAVSDEAQIRGALRRGGLEAFIDRIFCFKNTGLAKGEALYRHILTDLALRPADALMVGDDFEKDVRAANAAGLFAIWFNTRSRERREGSLHWTVTSMAELSAYFDSLDNRTAQC